MVVWGCVGSMPLLVKAELWVEGGRGTDSQAHIHNTVRIGFEDTEGINCSF